MAAKGNRYRHGHTAGGHSPTYISWHRMKTRCTKEECKDYPAYGGRGIKITKEWFTFENFLEDMGEKPDGYSLDRIDNSQGYNPKNCRWATAKQQANNRRSNRMLTFKGMTKTVAEWSEVVGIKQGTIGMRLNQYGWSVEKTLTKGGSFWLTQ